MQLYDSQRVFGDSSRSKNEFTYDQVSTILSICDAYGIEFFASVFDEEKLDWCIDLGVNLLKIASRTVVKEEALCSKIINTGKPTFVSLGFWKSNSLPFTSDNVMYFNCVSKYPTGILDQKCSVSKKYSDKIVGLSDHSYGISNCLYHIAMGARYIEKHFTLDKSLDGNDHIGSMNLEELRTLRNIGNQISVARDSGGIFL